jgi:gamma-glutamylputrescine oxidase
MPGYGSRYWAERTPARRRHAHPKFKGETTADVVVIGGGLTGCTAAYVLAAGGLDVVLVEADRIASGSTAGSLGAILPVPDAGFAATERAVGRRTARVAWKEAHRSARELASALRRLRIRCDLVDSSLVVNAREAEAATAIKKEHSARQAAGVGVSRLTAAAARVELGTSSLGALRERDAFLFDPVRASIGLAAAAARNGARVFERSTARRTRFTRTEATVAVGTGQITARGVFVATGAPGALFGQLRRHVRRAEGFVVVTEPIPAAMRREMGRRQSVVTEADAAPHWMRWLAEDRVLFAGALAPRVPARQHDRFVFQRTAQLMYELSIRHPVISGLPARWGWSMPVVSTADGLPWIGTHRNYPFHFFSLAFGWHGDGLAWFAARAALRHFRGESRREDEVCGFAKRL